MGRPSRQLRSFVAALVLILLAGFGFWPSQASARPAAPATPRQASQAAPELGGQLFSSGSPVEVQVLPASAGFTSELWLFEPGPAKRLATNRDVGLVVPVGTFAAGVELVFGIKVLNTGDTFKMGPGDRNPDGIPHATVDFLEPGRAQVGFEDLFGGGDRDYNDNMFEFRGGIIEQPPSGPTADAGPDQTVDEGAIVTLDGSASTDPDSQNLTYAWALSGHVGPPITLSSSTSATPTFQSLDDGTYTFTLTVSDGSATDTDQVVATVRNKIPVLSAQADPAYAGSVALVTTSFTDAGIIDTHAGTLLWGDGSAAQPVPVSVEGTGWGTLVASHVYATPGSYTVTITVTDDDGGAATTTVAGLQVIVPVALWANSNGTDAAMESTSGVVTVKGLTHTNDDLRIRGGAKSFTGPTEYVRTLDVGGAGATFTPAAVKTAIKPFPITFPIAQYRPGGRASIEAGPAYHNMSASCGSDGFWHVVGSTLASGVYYTTCGVKLNGNPLGGTITVAAEGDIQVSGSGAFFDPYIDGLLFVSYSTSTSSIKIDASGSTFFGYSFAERGTIAVSGSSDSFYCGILADRIDIASQNLKVTGSGCTRPARTIAPPTLVPTLDLDVKVDRADTLPAEALIHTATVTNSGATLVVPGVIGVEDLGTAQAKVTGHTLGLEYLSATDHAWHPLPGTVTITVRPNPFPGVAYPSGSEKIDGTVIQPGALASWGYAAVVRLSAADVGFLLDPSKVSAVRNTSTFTMTPTTVPVRRLFRFGDDFAAQLRALGGNATNVAVTIIPPAGDPRVFNGTTTPALATLTPGESVAVSLTSHAPAPAARAADESDAAYLARLASFDGSLLVGTGFARGTAAIGPILAPAKLATTTRHLPVVGLDKTGPASIEAGSTAQYALALRNTGSAEARGIVLSDAIAAIGARPVSGAPATLAPAATATAAATYPVPASATQSIVNTGTVRWTDAAANAYGPLNDALTTTVIAPRKLAVIKTDVTTGGSGPNPTISYEIAVTNLGDQPVSGVVVADTPDALTSLVVGSVTTTAGSVGTGNTAGDTSLSVNLGTVAGRTTQVVSFDATLGFVPEGVSTVSNQATVTSVELPAILSDDPGLPGATDPTITPVGPTSGGGGGGGGGGAARPAIGSPTPSDGAVVTEPVTISAVISPPEGQSVASWQISAGQAGSTTQTTLASGAGAGIDDPVTASAGFDPTRLPNGTYLVTIRSTASGGGIQTSTTSLVVDGNLKLGRYQTTYQDVAVGVAGLPMQVLRTYDSFDRSVGDFGPGWNVEIANFRVQVNRPLGYGGWIQETFGCSLIFCQTRYHSIVPHTVTVVWPDGHQEIFDLTPANGSTFFAPATAAGFSGRTRTTSTLTADGDTSLSYFGDGNLYGGGFGSGGIYDPQRFRLTAVDGTVYLLDRTVGLISATDRLGNTLTVSADGVTSSLGPSIVFERDSLGRIKKITEPGGKSLTYQYDAHGDLSVVTDQALREARYAYTDHYLTSIGGSSGPPIRTIGYTPDGRLDTITDGEGNVTSLDVDPAARTETLTGPDPRLTTIVTLDAHGDQTQVDQIFDGKHLVSKYVNNALGLPLETTDPLGHPSVATYDANGALKSLRDRDGVLTEVEYNSFSQPTDVKVAGQLQSHFDYFPTGLLQRITYPDSTFAEFGYDPQGHLTSTRDVTGISRTIHYDANGYPDTVTGPEGVTRMTHDPVGRLEDYTDPLNFTTTYGYDGVGNLTSVIDGNRHERTLVYDPLGRLSIERDALGAERRFTYDDASRIATVRDRNNVVTTLTYAPGGQPLTSTATDGTSFTNTYDGLGRLLTTDNGTARIELGWDDSSRLLSERLVGHAGSGLPTTTLNRTWTNAGQLKTIADAIGTTTFDYDSHGRLASIADPQTGAFSFGYDPLDRLASLTRPNGVNDTYTYLDGRLSSWNAKRGATVVDGVGIEYDSRGFPFRVTDSDGVHAFSHDALGQLTAATHPAGSGVPAESYHYDGAGNRLDWTGNPAASVSYDNANRLRSDATYTYGYDGEGRLTSRTRRSTGVTTTFGWNSRGQLVGATQPSALPIAYKYDPVGRRIETAVGSVAQRTIYAGPNPRLVLDGANVVQARLVEGLGFDGLLGSTSSGTTSYPLAQASTVRETTDAAGAVVERFRYDSFGNPGSGTTPSSPHGWDGLAIDPLGMYSARARTYDPATGRFLSEDPLASLNSYTFAGDSPLMASDPTGLNLVEYSELNSEEEASAEEVCTTGLTLAGFTMDIALEVGLSVALAPFSGVPGLYEFYDVQAGKPYVGKSIDVARRLSEHIAAGRLDPTSTVNVRALEGITDEGLANAEQLAIQTCGTPGKNNTGTLANKINAINRSRRDELAKTSKNLADYLAGLGFK